jgi:hypothetical protein
MDVSGHPGNQMLPAYLSGHGSTINGNALSRRATLARLPSVRGHEHPVPYAYRTSSMSGRRPGKRRFRACRFGADVCNTCALHACRPIDPF